MNGPGNRSGLMVLLTSGIVDEELGRDDRVLSTASLVPRGRSGVEPAPRSRRSSLGTLLSPERSGLTSRAHKAQLLTGTVLARMRWLSGLAGLVV